MNYYFQAFTNFVNFSDRSRRKEYWYFFLFNVIFAIALNVLDLSMNWMITQDKGVTSSLYQVATFIPSLAVGVRRMHDTGRSGWNLLIPIYNLYLLAIPGDKGKNLYGEDPKQVVLDIE